MKNLNEKIMKLEEELIETKVITCLTVSKQKTKIQLWNFVWFFEQSKMSETNQLKQKILAIDKMLELYNMTKREIVANKEGLIVSNQSIESKKSSNSMKSDTNQQVKIHRRKTQNVILALEHFR